MVESGRILLSFVEAPGNVRLYLPEGDTLRLTEGPAEYLRVLMESELPLTEEGLYFKMFGKLPFKMDMLVLDVHLIRSDLFGSYNK